MPVIVALLLIGAHALLFLFALKWVIIIIGGISGIIWFLYQNHKKIVNDKNATVSDVDSEEENHLSTETKNIKNREFYTKDVVPKNYKHLKINYSALLIYPLHTRMWRLGITNYAEMYSKYPQYITEQEYRDLELYRLDCNEYQKEVMANNSVDNVIEFKGMYFDNENSEAAEWRRFKRFRKYYNERYGEESSNQNLDEFPHDYYQEQLSDLEDMEYCGYDMSPEEISDVYNDVLDEYTSELEEYNNRKNNY